MSRGASARRGASQTGRMSRVHGVLGHTGCWGTQAQWGENSRWLRKVTPGRAREGDSRDQRHGWKGRGQAEQGRSFKSGHILVLNREWGCSLAAPRKMPMLERRFRGLVHRVGQGEWPWGHGNQLGT